MVSAGHVGGIVSSAADVLWMSPNRNAIQIYFAGHGKKTTMKLLLENPDFLDAMCSLGSELVPTANTLQQAERSICIMYKSTQYTSTKFTFGAIG